MRGTSESIKRAHALGAFRFFYDAAVEWRMKAMRCDSWCGTVHAGDLVTEARCEVCGISLPNHPNMTVEYA